MKRNHAVRRVTFAGVSVLMMASVLSGCALYEALESPPPEPVEGVITGAYEDVHIRYTSTGGRIETPYYVFVIDTNTDGEGDRLVEVPYDTWVEGTVGDTFNRYEEPTTGSEE